MLSDILGAPEPHFSHNLRNWERLSGGNSHDVRLTSDIVHGRRKVVQQLGLDVDDTTAKELYFALRHRAAETNLQLEKRLAITGEDTPQDVAKKIVTFIDSLTLNRDVWVVKHACIKQLLKKQPPKKTLKALGLRSIDSVLKRGSGYELLTIAYHTEPAEWTNKVHGCFKKLNSTDFQAVKSQIFIVDKNRAEKLRKGGFNSHRIIIPNFETGTVMLLPSPRRFPQDTLAMTLAILQTLYEARVYSAYFRLRSVKPDFGEYFCDAILNGLRGNIKEHEIGWKVLQRYFAQNPQSFANVEQPHLQHEDVDVELPIETLAREFADSHMPFWADAAYIFVADDDEPVSMHLLDVVTNASNQRQHTEGSTDYVQQRVWEELSHRYMQNPAFLKDVMSRIDFEDEDIV